ARFIRVEAGPPLFDPNMPPGDPARLREPLQKRPDPGLKFRIVRGCRQQHADPPHALALLRSRPDRPRRRRATEQRDELAAHDLRAHSITSSAATCSVGGTVRPSALAVLRFITNSNLVGCKTGKSVGFSPLRIRPV